MAKIKNSATTKVGCFGAAGARVQSTAFCTGSYGSVPLCDEEDNILFSLCGKSIKDYIFYY